MLKASDVAYYCRGRIEVIEVANVRRMPLKIAERASVLSHKAERMNGIARMVDLIE